MLERIEPESTDAFREKGTYQFINNVLELYVDEKPVVTGTFYFIDPGTFVYETTTAGTLKFSRIGSKTRIR